MAYRCLRIINSFILWCQIIASWMLRLHVCEMLIASYKAEQLTPHAFVQVLIMSNDLTHSAVRGTCSTQ